MKIAGIMRVRVWNVIEETIRYSHLPDCRAKRILTFLDQSSNEEPQAEIQEEQIDDPEDIDFDPQEIHVDEQSSNSEVELDDPPFFEEILLTNVSQKFQFLLEKITIHCDNDQKHYKNNS
ncbi:hypothetical protein FQR65_LT09889 [Abscondita terminalis]|nr:hypothetical protein FQR65_LT09889 [Abscondita terminalis]